LKYSPSKEFPFDQKYSPCPWGRLSFQNPEYLEMIISRE
jgi:hypothetical protein